MTGYIRLHRKIRDNQLFKKNPLARLLFEDLCLDASWRDTVQDWMGTAVNVGRGELMMSQREMSERYGLSRQTVRTMLKSLVSHKMIKINPLPNQGPTIVSICNYSDYQGDQPTSNHEPNQPPTHLQPTKEKDKKDKKEKKDSLLDCPEVVDAFERYNRTAESCGLAIASKLTSERETKIKARLKEHGLDGWTKALENIEKSAWLCEGGRANLDWMLCPRKLLRTIEGNYGNGRHRSATADAKAQGKSLFELVGRDGVRL